MNLDPEVLAWEADNAALQVAGDSAMAGLKAAKFVADGVLNLASFILDDIVKNVRLYIILNGLLGQYTSNTYGLVLLYMVYWFVWKAPHTGFNVALPLVFVSTSHNEY